MKPNRTYGPQSVNRFQLWWWSGNTDSTQVSAKCTFALPIRAPKWLTFLCVFYHHIIVWTMTAVQCNRSNYFNALCTLVRLQKLSTITQYLAVSRIPHKIKIEQFAKVRARCTEKPLYFSSDSPLHSRPANCWSSRMAEKVDVTLWVTKQNASVWSSTYTELYARNLSFGWLRYRRICKWNWCINGKRFARELINIYINNRVIHLTEFSELEFCDRNPVRC